MKLMTYQRLFLIITICFVVCSSAFADQIEKRGVFRFNAGQVVFNEHENFKINPETQIVNANGTKVSPEQLNYARIIIIDTDSTGNIKKIIITGWWE